MKNKSKKLAPKKPLNKGDVACRVRCSWEEISSLENGIYADFGHLKLYTTEFSPKKVEKILNDYLAEHGG